MALKWDPRTMATGVEEIDAQHQELIQHLNEFFNLMHMGRGGDGLDEFMDFLSQYAAWHFKHEEGCMEEYRCPAAAANKRAHQTFIQIFRGYRNRLLEEGPYGLRTCACQVPTHTGQGEGHDNDWERLLFHGMDLLLSGCHFLTILVR